MYIQTYTHTLHVWLAWLKVHRKTLLGGLFAVLACVHTAMVSDSVTDAYLLIRMKQPERVQVYSPSRKVVVRRRRLAIATPPSSASSSSVSPVSPQKPFVPHGSSAEPLHGAAGEDSSSSASSGFPSVDRGSFSSSATSSSSKTPSSVGLPSDPSFPAFERAVMPVSRVPNWGDMRTPDEWNRSYEEMRSSDFVALPPYDIRDLTSRTMDQLKANRDSADSIRLLTQKLTWSTRFFGAYDLDAGEFSGIHPGVDIKLAEGTPVGAVAGGRVNAVIRKATGLGTHVIIEHRTADGEQYFSIYGHLGSTSVSAGDAVRPGQTIGTVGMTGKTTAPHLHLQIDRGKGEETHAPYMPDHLPNRSEATRFTINPITFIHSH